MPLLGGVRVIKGRSQLHFPSVSVLRDDTLPNIEFAKYFSLRALLPHTGHNALRAFKGAKASPAHDPRL